MKRVLAVLASASFVLAIGCSDYDIRLEKTLEEKKYEKRLNDNLEAAPTKGSLQGDEIFIRPPLGLEGPTQASASPPPKPGSLTSKTASSTQRRERVSTSLRESRSPRPRPAPRRRRRPPSNRRRGANSSTTLSSWSRPPITSSSPPASSSPSPRHMETGQRLQSREAGPDDESRRGVCLHRIQRCPRRRDDLRVSQGREDLYGAEDRSLFGEFRRRRSGQAVLRWGDGDRRGWGGGEMASPGAGPPI